MSERFLRRKNNTNCENYCPIAPVFKNTQHTIVESNAIRLSKLILNNKKKPEIVYSSVNRFGGRGGNYGGFRGIPRNSMA